MTTIINADEIPQEQGRTTMTETTDWPFDAIQDDPLTALRIPVVTNPYPGWKYEVCLLVAAPDGFGPEGLYGQALRPDETETRQIAAYIEYRMGYYNESWKAKMRLRALDVDGTTNTVVLCKRAEGDWCYRRWSWQTGPFMVPVKDAEHLSLERLLDKIHDLVPEKWTAFKVAHSDAFPEPTEAVARDL